MRQGLHTKLVLIMLLLILSLMAVVCAFLMRGVLGFYLNEFYDQMATVFSRVEFVGDLRSAVEEDNYVERTQEIIGVYAGPLGIDAGTGTSTRNYYILDGVTGEVLAGSADDPIEMTPNIVTALNGNEGYASNSTADYMDVAIPISSGGNSLIVYIRDNKQTVQDLNMELFFIIMEALIIGFVISILLSFLLSKTMVTPIQSLTKAAERVADGNFSEKIEVQARDEIGTLTRAFNNMATRLHDTLEEIESEKNKLSTLFLHMTDGVMSFSRDGHITSYNPAAERLLGKDFDSCEGGFAEVFGEFAELDKLMKLKNPDSLDIELSLNGRELELFFAPISGGESQDIIVVIHDITQQKKADELRREFVANVSHELRTPITSIRSYAETLAQNGEEIPAEMRRNFLDVIVNESDRMTTIVQDLLALSKFDSESENMRAEKFSIARSIDSIYNALYLETKKHNLDMSMEFQGMLPDIEGDRARIEQVILNIVSNAIRYTPDGGSIEICAGSTKEEVWISVKDTGIGIPDEDIPHIFDRFYRVDKARSRMSGGTGLGLSITKEIVDRHNGRIEVSSVVGQGTTVKVWLPIKSAAAKENEL